MQRKHVAVILLGLSIGCSSSPSRFADKRPPISPRPANVQAEIRDARFFLPYPDEEVGPQTSMQPRSAGGLLPRERP